LPKYFSSEWSHSQFRLPPPAVPNPRSLPFMSPPPGSPAVAPTVEDDVCICAWIDFAPVEPPSRILTQISTKSKSKRSSGHNATEVATKPKPKTDIQLVAITHSGGWYRLSLGASTSPSPPTMGLNGGGEGDCKVEEYRRWGFDGWD